MALISFRLKKVACQHAQNATFGLFAAARLFRETAAGCVSSGSTFVAINSHEGVNEIYENTHARNSMENRTTLD